LLIRTIQHINVFRSGIPVAAARNGADIVVTFKDTGGGLKTCSADRAIGFEVCADTACRSADARAAGDTAVLPGAAAAGVTRVRYAWADAPFVNLFGGDGLPAAPFRLDVR
jgi:sialate O-acetylesterase